MSRSVSGLRRGFFIVYVAGDAGRIADGYRLLYAEIGKRTVRLLDPFTLDTGKMDLRTWSARQPQLSAPRKGIVRRAIRKNLELRERTELVKSCLASMREDI